jgi:SnoaL-like domain
LTVTVTNTPEKDQEVEIWVRAIDGGDFEVFDAVLSGMLKQPSVVSYPVFESLFGTPAIRGREAVKAFVTRFGQKWADPHFEFNEALADGDRVVLLWSFRARDVGPPPPGQPAANQEHSWGGITLLRFDKGGKIVAEVGGESEPGPTRRQEEREGPRENPSWANP